MLDAITISPFQAVGVDRVLVTPAMRGFRPLLWHQGHVPKRHCDIGSGRFIIAIIKVSSAGGIAYGRQLISAENVKKLCPRRIVQAVTIQVRNRLTIGNTLPNDSGDSFGLLTWACDSVLTLTPNTLGMAIIAIADSLICGYHNG
jgi:hypothetical protein